ncbi:glycosyltransferase family 4 protein [bacterium]|nr:glycosyltransferase family 4 protein [bacterium]
MGKQKIKLCHMGIKGLPSKGGAERVAEAIIERLAATDKYEIYVYAMKGFCPDYEPPKNVHIIEIPVIEGKHIRPLLLGLLSALHALFLGSYDLVHLHNVEMSFAVPILRLRYRVVTTSHGYQVRPKWNSLVKLIWQQMDYPFLWLSNTATAVSSYHKHYYEKKYGKEVLYIPNGTEELPENIEAADKILKEHNVQPGSYILFAAGRIIPSKGPHFLLEAYRKLNLDIPILLVGDYSHVPEYVKKLKSLATDNVHFIPLIQDKSVLFGLIKESRLFVLPSTMEASSMMLLEVASVGIPLIASDIPENLALIKDHAIFFKSGSVPDLAEKIKYCLDNISTAQEKAKSTKLWIKENYHWDKIVNDYCAVYKKLIM